MRRIGQTRESFLGKFAAQQPTIVASQSEWLAAMYRGDFQRAWEITDRLEWPRRRAERAGRFYWSPEYLLWNGDSFEGRSIVVHCNHGLGDTVQFVRFLPRIAQLAKEVILLAQPPLVPLLSGVPGFGEVRNGWAVTDSLPVGAVPIEVMELGYGLRISPEQIPLTVPYLPGADVHKKSQLRIEGLGQGRRHVGLFWESSSWDPTRSIPLKSWEPLGGIDDVKYYSLQPGEVPVADAPFPMELLGKSTGAILDAACALLQLDLLITVDAMIAHLAGALGRPVWLLLKEGADWRWMSGRSDSPWYPSMRIFRQKSAGNWGEVMEEVAEALRNKRLEGNGALLGR